MWFGSLGAANLEQRVLVAFALKVDKVVRDRHRHHRAWRARLLRGGSDVGEESAVAMSCPISTG